MALTPLRWAALAVGGALIVASILFRPAREPRRVTDARQALADRAWFVNAAAYRTAEHVRALHLRDSVLGALARLPRADTSRVFIDRGLPEHLPRALSNLATRTRGYRAAQPRVPVDLVFVLDTARFIRGVARARGGLLAADFVLPGAGSDRCVVIARVRPLANDVTAMAQRDVAWAFVRSDYTVRLLGPCAFVERFGWPGPAIDEWFMSGAWGYGVAVRWHRPSVAWAGPEWYRDFNRGETGWPLRDWISNEGFRCVSGDEATCETLVTRPVRRSDSRAVSVMPGARMVDATSLSDYYYRWQRRPLGPFQDSYLSDMVRDIGPERFQQFWSSSQPVGAAFQQATGTGLGEWTIRWGEQSYGRQGRGPGMRPTAMLLALGLVAVSAAGAGVAARRRQAS